MTETAKPNRRILPVYQGEPSEQFDGKTVVRGTVRKIIGTKKDTDWLCIAVNPIEEARDFNASGVMPGIAEGVTIELVGNWVESEKFGRTFKAVSAFYDISRETSEEVVVAILSGRWFPGIGEKKAEEIYKMFGPQTMTVIKENAQRLTCVPGIGKKTADKLSECVKSFSEQLQLAQFLKPEVTDAMIEKLIQNYGSAKRVLSDIRKDPYKMIQKVDGVGFRKADNIARNTFSIPLNDPRRIKAAITCALLDATKSGDCFLMIEQIAQQTQKYASNCGVEIGFTRNEVNAQLATLQKDDKIVCVRTPDKRTAVYHPVIYRAEKEVATRLAEILKAPDKAMPVFKESVKQGIAQTEEQYVKEYNVEFKFEDFQRKAVEEALKNRITIITGGPGTGKTTCMRAILNAYRQQYSAQEILLCAPTGRAASRMQEVTKLPAKTIHSALSSGAKAFVVADEVSMVDIEVMAMLLRLVAEDGRLVLIGDPDQLPSVGPGNVLIDLIDSGVIPVVKLKVGYRNSGSIAKNADRINRGILMEEFDEDENFQFYPAYDEDLRATVLDKYFENVEKFGIKETCLITPMRKKNAGYTSASDLNLIIRDKLNPGKALGDDGVPLKPTTSSGIVFRVGDRVMLTKNHNYPQYPRLLVNGDVGTVTACDNKRVSVLLDDPATQISKREYVDDETHLKKIVVEEKEVPVEITVERGLAEREFILAYASTVHKCQGMEYKSIVFACGKEHAFMLQRNLVYTAITRAKKCCTIVGDASYVDYAAKTVRNITRNTLLKIRLCKCVKGV